MPKSEEKAAPVVRLRVAVTRAQYEYVQRQVRTGRFVSVSELVRAALAAHEIENRRKA